MLLTMLFRKLSGSGRALRALLAWLLVLVAAGELPPQAQAAPTGAPQIITLDRIPTDEPVVALTFDAGSDRGYAASILNTLADAGVRASFGMTGRWAEQHPDLLARIAGEGHQIINHTWSHRSFTGRSTGEPRMTSAEIAAELERLEELLRAQGVPQGKPYVRPPYGDVDTAALQALSDAGYRYNVMWSIDTLGWKGLSSAQIVRRVLENAAPGAIVLMHVGGESADGPALAQIIAGLRERGYRFATVAELAEPRQLFPETGHWVRGDFLAFWRQHGGLPVFGYPLREEASERNDDDGHVYSVQYFERQRFERHPENAPPYHVLLGRLGVAEAQARGLLGTPPFQPQPPRGDAACAYFAETGHHLCAGFRAYWRAHGLEFGEPGVSGAESLALFGYPISEEFALRLEDGRTYTVQYFERARLEYHPENPFPYTVLQGRLGLVASFHSNDADGRPDGHRTNDGLARQGVVGTKWCTRARLVHLHVESP
jgi:peptidoglycan/xylan/chitin deacetylase (PgdA/CDA1 family)